MSKEDFLLVTRFMNVTKANGEFPGQWNKRIQILRRIQDLGFIVQLTMCLGFECRIWNHLGDKFNIESNSFEKATDEAIVDFVKWWNTKNKDAYFKHTKNNGGC